jgi:thymidylate synthase ThyX
MGGIMNKYLVTEHMFNTIKGTSVTIQFWSGEVAEVSLIDYPVHAEQTLARTVRGYTGYYENQPVPSSEIEFFFRNLKNTKLGTPAEMLNFVFLVRDVPRSWTHQAVRTRVGAAVVQESTRFIGARSVYKVLTPSSVINAGGLIDLSYHAGTIASIRAYANLVEQENIPSQDARQLLPHSLLTHMYWSLTLKTLMGIYNQRWCCQAEPSTWIPVMRQMKALITISCGEDIASFLSAPIDRGENCGFNATFDRPCTWRKRV